MDLAILVGLVLGISSIVGGIWLAAAAAGGAGMGGFISGSSFAIVFGGMIASLAVAFPLKDVLGLGAAISAVMKGDGKPLGNLVDDAVKMADIGRKGAADIEKNLDSIQNYFFKDGCQMVVDGYSLDELTDILETRIEYREQREKIQSEMFKSMGDMSPAWGMIGTLIGLVIMLSGFGGDGGADSLGPGMSAALITTFYGAVFANLFFLPMSAKLSQKMNASTTAQALLVEATRLLHQKKHPLIVREKLNSFIPPKEWKQEG
ncbi:MAG: hypothetical protein HN657_05740 [Candidatus Marinimicrobia bacterium]|jgi:chemotaxis protein MotA|nr:hypothetical protein [Candidatus Neomarinimicrobiota bacterium]MBT3497181.1 hypothetical protein [Candidatus Neomarinimicrobiota bacterium]MBT3732570.1 hypothetical protein [Candidatus Neomarinimicrobiota bacterium]MBT4143676.1 hypothetical protein [Candidatus Neomarinimicrobiota bacterium]MBT4178062.1 hypothetical protein [Candidatus Neomarinimicrobiota bacterium]